MSDSVVRVVNKGDDDFEGQYDRNRYPISAGSESIIPWDAACLWLGDPRLRDAGTDRARLEEYRRLTSKFGVYDEHDRFDDARPKLEIYRLNGTRVKMLAEEPFGTPVDVFGDTEGEVDLQTQVSQLQAMVNELQERSGDGSLPDVSDVESGEGPDADDDGNELPTDSASTFPSTPPANASAPSSSPESFQFPGSST